MKKAYIALVAFVGASMYMLGQAQVSAGILAGQQVTPSVTYEFIECRRPQIANPPIYDRDSYLKAIDDYNALVEQVNAYQTCIRREAESDMRIQTEVIRTAYENESELIRLNLAEMRNGLNGWADGR